MINTQEPSGNRVRLHASVLLPRELIDLASRHAIDVYFTTQ